MKKKVLLSVFAAALVAAPAVSARELVANQEDGPIFQPATPDQLNDKNFTGELTPAGKAAFDKSFEDSTKAKYGKTLEPKKDKDGKVIPGEFVVKGNAAANKAMQAKKPAAGHKALPKTSAAK